MHSHKILELIRYGIVGGLSAFSYFAGSNLINFLKAPSVVSSGTGWLIALAVSYFGHINITYRVQTDHKRMGWKFIVLCGVNLLYSLSVTYLVFDILDQPYPLVSGIVTVTMPFLAYPIGKYWVFREEKAS